MAKLKIDKSILINKPVNEVFNTLNNFDTWTAWSPWLIMEPDVKVTVSDDKKYYEWAGDITGEGNMKIAKERENEAIDIDLQFLKPWKSQAKVGFILKTEGSGTRVRWTMDSSLPFFLFWMKTKTEAFIGMDYMRGLEMLKDYCEDGTVHSTLDFKGESNYEGCNYIGIKINCKMDDIKDSMSKNFVTLTGFMADKQDKMAGPPFSIYHEWDMVKKTCSYTACVPVNTNIDGLPSGMISGTIPKTKIHTVHHKGSYRHIGNAWSSLYSRQQAKKFKMNKGIDPIEVYLNSPMDTEENELQAEIHFPIK